MMKLYERLLAICYQNQLRIKLLQYKFPATITGFNIRFRANLFALKTGFLFNNSTLQHLL